ncbi:hypothetical protein ACFL6K_03395 [Candidatus Latescibacterota bacterium]
MIKTKKKNNRLLIWVIIVVSVFGNIYFGYRAISENTRTSSENDNPFEYNIDSYKVIDPELLHYTETNMIPICFEEVSGLALGAEGNIIVTGDESVLIMKPDGEALSTISTDGTAICVHVAENGDICLGMVDHVEIYNSDGILKNRWDSLGENAMITSIVSSEDFVFIADAGNSVVLKYDTQGNELLKIAEKDESRDIPGCLIPGRFFDVSIDPDGFLWVVNPGRHSIENYTFDGDLRTSWGTYSMEIEGFCGCCNPSHITIMDDGKFVTSEKGIPRVKVYNRLGNLESVVAGPAQFIEGTEGLDLARNADGTIYILDPMKKAVRIFEKKNPEV